MRPSPRRLGYLVGGVLAAGALAASVAGSASGPTPAAATGRPHAPVAPVIPAVQFSVTPANRLTGISPTQPVVVQARNGTLVSVHMTGPSGRLVAGAADRTRAIWRSTGPLRYATSYQVLAVGVNVRGTRASTITRFTTARPANLTHAYLTPGDGEVVGVGQPVVVRFDERVPDKTAAVRALSVTTTPAVRGAWSWVDDQTAHWRPVRYWPVHTRVFVRAALFGREFGRELYGQDNTTASFTIGDSWIAIGNVHTHTLAVFHNGARVRTLPASFGRPKYPTHDGVHVVTEKFPMYLMNSSTWGLPADAPGGYKDFKAYWAVRISSDGEFVHANDGTIWAQGSSNVTHGCINLSSSNAHWFYRRFGRGDVVEVVGGWPTLPVWDGVGDWNVPWSQWLKGAV